MNMSIQNNILAMNAERMVGITSGKKSKSTEKMSSGYRVNRAADDAAGVAISEKMRRQIKGLTQGTRNTQDGISMCQIAEGALDEVNSMLHRLTELSVQSANGTNNPEDRQYIQEEVSDILLEIDRVSETTSFNEQNILSPTIKITGSIMSREQAMNELSSGSFKTVGEDIKDANGNVILSKNAANAMFATMSLYYATDKLYDEYKEGELQYDGRNGEQTRKMSELMKMAVDATEKWSGWKNVDLGSGLSDKRTLSEKYVSATSAYDPGPATRPGYNPDNASSYATTFAHGNNNELTALGTVHYQDGELKYEAGYHFTDAALYRIGFVALDAATYYADKSHHGYQRNREDQSFGDALDGLAAAMRKLPTEDQTSVDETLVYYANGVNDKESIADLYAYLCSDGTIEVETTKNIWIQSGAEEGDGLYIEFDAINCQTMGISGLDVTTEDGASSAISDVKDALKILMESRAQIGAQQNRLEHTINNLNNVVENTTAAESQIRDTDMATEMVEYSNQNILEQAGVSMLSQANQQTQGILSLLQ